MITLRYLLAILSVIFIFIAWQNADFVNNPNTAWFLNILWAGCLGGFLYLNSKKDEE